MFAGFLCCKDTILFVFDKCLGRDFEAVKILFLLRRLPADFSICSGAFLQHLLVCCMVNGDSFFSSFILHLFIGTLLCVTAVTSPYLLI